jgi:hypothetical protein
VNASSAYALAADDRALLGGRELAPLYRDHPGNGREYCRSIGAEQYLVNGSSFRHIFNDVPGFEWHSGGHEVQPAIVAGGSQQYISRHLSSPKAHAMHAGPGVNVNRKFDALR